MFLSLGPAITQRRDIRFDPKRLDPRRICYLLGRLVTITVERMQSLCYSQAAKQS